MEVMEAGPYPVREGEPDCSYYIRTGLCRFGATCRFNHPPNRKLAIATAKMRGEYPERAGQPECQYYLKTGTCKFGSTCRFHHPRDKAGIAGGVLGYPLRTDEAECPDYMRTGQCKFGSTCKFHHPQPSNMMVSYRGSPAHPIVQSPTSPGQQSFPGGITNLSLSRASLIPRWKAPSNYAPMNLPHLGSRWSAVPGWSAYGDKDESANLETTNLSKAFDSDEIWEYISSPQWDSAATKEELYKIEELSSEASGDVPVKLPAKMKKSASMKLPFFNFEEENIVDARRPETVKERKKAAVEGDDDVEVDAKANDFINKFKHKLKSQRMDSIIKYKEMVNRGGEK